MLVGQQLAFYGAGQLAVRDVGRDGRQQCGGFGQWPHQPQPEETVRYFLGNRTLQQGPAVDLETTSAQLGYVRMRG
ncbi:hypothetical protein GCM10010274_49330 [Streptomyces lavendofoliae]|uniref:Uncharacterized protein n=1 Tax=Streptomyces lavendofoliae TaxID=67314 RepID=A0A918I2V3_9ACTN|nr:hypothetical protein GCM10010274_49330 [Streptomyces lavendofoliae]